MQIITNRTDEVNDVSIPSREYEDYMKILKPLHDLLGGTRLMRERGEIYLPRMLAEEDLSYVNRKNRSILYSGFKRTVQKLTGEVFSMPISVNPDVNPEMTKWLLEDIDGKGKSITRFAKDLLYHSIIDGVGYILVEFPKVRTRTNDNGIIEYLETFENTVNPSPAEWRPFTKAVEETKGWRPRWVHYKAEDIIGGRVSNINGETLLEQIRIKEISEEPAGKYGTEYVERIRVLEPGRYELWRKTDSDTDNGEYGWYLEDEGETSLPFIPLIMYMTGEERTPITADPPLEGCAYMNIAHWQSNSDQRNILHFSRMVLWFGKMLAIDPYTDSVPFGSNRLIQASSPDADLKAVEHNGKAIESGRQDLKDLETGMAMFGLTFMMPKSGAITATERAIDASENDSALKGWAVALNDMLNTAVDYTGQMIGKPKGQSGTVNVNTEFRTFLTDQSTAVLLESFKANLLPRDIIITEFMRRGLISEEIDLVEVSALLEKDMKNNNAFINTLENQMNIQRNTYNQDNENNDDNE